MHGERLRAAVLRHHERGGDRPAVRSGSELGRVRRQRLRGRVAGSELLDLAQALLLRLEARLPVRLLATSLIDTVLDLGQRLVARADEVAEPDLSGTERRPLQLGEERGAELFCAQDGEGGLGAPEQLLVVDAEAAPDGVDLRAHRVLAHGRELAAQPELISGDLLAIDEPVDRMAAEVGRPRSNAEIEVLTGDHAVRRAHHVEVPYRLARHGDEARRDGPDRRVGLADVDVREHLDPLRLLDGVRDHAPERGIELQLHGLGLLCVRGSDDQEPVIAGRPRRAPSPSDLQDLAGRRMIDLELEAQALAKIVRVARWAEHDATVDHEHVLAHARGVEDLALVQAHTEVDA